MAQERIESGRMQIAGPGGVPMQQISQSQVDYVAPRVQAQGSNLLAQLLDRMSASLFQQAGEFRQREGLEFVANNPITQEQIEAAKRGDVSSITNDTGLNIFEQAMRGDVSGLTKKAGFTIFEQAVRKARSLELSAQFEAEGRNELVKLLSDVESGVTTSSDVSAKIKIITDGYTKTLSKVDPDASFKFRATMATHGNTVLKAAYETELKRAKNKRMAMFDMDFDNGVRLLEATVAQEPERIDELADVFRTNVLTQSLLLGDMATQKEYSTKFETALRNAKINAMTRHLTSDEYMANPDETLARIRRGDVGRMGAVMQTMIVNDFDAVAKVTANFMVAVNQREMLANQKREAEKRAGQDAAINLLEQIFPLPEGSAKRKELVGQLTALPSGSVPIGTLKDLLDPNTSSNPMLLGNLYYGIDRGTIANKAQIDAYVGKGISGQDYISLIKYLNASDRRDQRELQQGISRLAGIPVIPGQMIVLDPKGAEFQRRQELESEALRIQADAVKLGRSMTTSQVLQQLETNIATRRGNETAVNARKQLEAYENKDWVGGPITRDKLPSLEKKAGNDKNKQAELRRIKQLLDQADGLTSGRTK